MLTLKVPEMSCQHCVATVTKAIQGLDGGARVDADLGSKLVRIESAAPADRISDAIRSSGYENTAVAG